MSHIFLPVNFWGRKTYRSSNPNFSHFPYFFRGYNFEILTKKLANRASYRLEVDNFVPEIRRASKNRSPNRPFPVHMYTKKHTLQTLHFEYPIHFFHHHRHDYYYTLSASKEVRKSSTPQSLSCSHGLWCTWSQHSRGLLLREGFRSFVLDM